MKRYALVIGISEYENRYLPSLLKPAASAEAIAQLLEAHGNFQEVRRLPAEWLSADRAQVGRLPLTEAQLSAELKRLLQEQATGCEVLIFFSGHGFVVSDNLGGSEAYLAASDTQIGFEQGRILWQQNGVRLRSLSEQFGTANFSSLVVLLDCCHSGSLIESQMIQQALGVSRRDYSLIAACRGFEKAYEGEADQPHSLFTAALLAGLSPSQADSQGQVSSGRLFDYLYQALKGTGQEPIQLGAGRSLTIVSYPIQQAEAPAKFNPANPYVGLTAFEAYQADYFYGRDPEVEELLRRLDPLQTPPRRFLAVIGPSGSGKSSLVKAGLLPALQNDRLPGSRDWQIESIMPGPAPKAELTKAIARHQNRNRPFVLFIDQFEELFTLCHNEEEQREFLMLLQREAMESDRHTRVIITIRGDFLDRCIQYREAADLINSAQPGTFLVAPLTDMKLASRLGDVILKPAHSHGVEFDDGLPLQMVSEVLNQMGAMPLLQYALTELWDACIQNEQSDRRLTWNAYRAIGGVKGALQRRADLIYDGLTTSDKEFVRKLLLELVQFGEDGEVTRRVASWDDLRRLGAADQLERVMGQLTSQRLLVADETYVEVAHESLLTEAPLIHNWVEENRETIRLSRRLERDCDEWVEQSKSEDYLLNAGKLAAIDEWLTTTQPNLSDLEHEFLQKSRERRNQEAQAELEQERKMRELAEARQQEAEARALAELNSKLEAEARAEAESDRAKESNARVKAEKQRTRVAIGALIGIIALSTLGALQWRAADQKQIEALVTASRALFQSNRDTLDALKTALQAQKQLRQSLWFRSDPELQSDVMEVLAEATYWVRERNRITAHNSYVYSVRFSPDVQPQNQIFATASDDKTVKLWGLNGQLLNTLKHPQSVTALDFSHNGQFLASADYDGTVKLWKRDGSPVADLARQGQPVWSLAFSPTDDATIAIAGSEGTVVLINRQDNSRKSWKAHNQAIYSVSFSSDGQTIATASADGTVKFWDRNGKSRYSALKGHRGTVYRVRFSPLDDRIVATAGEDNTAILWNLAEQKQVAQLSDHASDVFDVVFSPNGKTIATAGRDSTLKLWNSQGKLLSTLEGHQDRVNSLSFSADGKTLASASNDKTVKLWQPDFAYLAVVRHPNRVRRVNISPDGQTIASADVDNNLVLWKRNGDYIHKWQETSPVYDIAFSPNSKLLAAAKQDGTVSLHTLADRSSHNLGKHNSWITGVSFSFDGTTIATASSDKTAKFWSLDGRNLGGFKTTTMLNRIRFSPDDNIVATASAEDGTASVWNRDGSLRLPLKGHKPDTPVYSANFSPDGQRLATVSEDNTAIIWDSAGRLLHRLEGHRAGVTAADFQPPTGQMLATSSSDQTIKLWNSEGKLITTLIGHRASVNSLRFSPDGKLLATAGSDKTVLLWNTENLSLEGLAQRGCNWIQDYLRKPEATQVDSCSIQ